MQINGSTHHLNKTGAHLSDDILIMIDAERRILALNKPGRELLGYTGEAVLGKDAAVLFADDVSLRGVIKKIRDEGYFSSHRLALKTGAGGIVTADVSGSLLDSTEGRKEYIALAAKNISGPEAGAGASIYSCEIARAVLDSMNDSLCIIDAGDRRILAVNDTFLREFGLKKEEAIGRTCYEVTHKSGEPCTPPFDDCPLVKTMVTGERADAEHTHFDGGGEERYVMVMTLPVKNEEGTVEKVIHISKDITGRRLAENGIMMSQDMLVRDHHRLKQLYRRMKLSEIQWEMTMDAVEDVVVLTNERGEVRKYNKAFRMLTGMTDDQLKGRSCEELLKKSGVVINNAFGGSLEICQESTGRWFVLNSYSLQDREHGFSGYVFVLHNNTEMKMVTEELKRYGFIINENRQRLQSALNKLSSLMQNVIEHVQYDFVFDNPYLLKCYELKKCRRKACPCYGKEPMRCWQTVGTFCGGERHSAFSGKYGNCTECEVYKHATMDPIYEIGEHFNNMMHVLEIKNRELGTAYEELKTTQSRMLQREKMASIGQIAAGVAHEINNPAGFILSNLRTLEKYVKKLKEFILAQSGTIEELSDGKKPESIGELRKKLKLDYVMDDLGQLIHESIEGTDRIRGIVQNLKSFSRIDEAGYKDADINECIRSTLNIVWNELKYHAAVEKDFGTLPRIRCYPQQLNQVFVNLLMNAAQAIETQGVIGIRTWSSDGAVHVEISDTGCGISEENISRVFEPFFTTKETGKGTGLGLSIAYDIVKKHNGEMTIESRIGKGSTFTVRIPCGEDA